MEVRINRDVVAKTLGRSKQRLELDLLYWRLRLGRSGSSAMLIEGADSGVPLACE